MTLIEHLIDKKAREISVRRALVPPASASNGLPELIDLIVRMFECRDDLIDAQAAYDESFGDDQDDLKEIKLAAEKSYADVLKELREAVGM